MIIGPTHSEMVEAAKQIVARHFVSQAESDGVPPTLRAMYVIKAQEARTVLDGGSSEMISAEAELRGITPEQMAQVIDQMSRESKELELARMRTNVSIENAGTRAEVVQILSDLGLRLVYPAPV